MGMNVQRHAPAVFMLEEDLCCSLDRNLGWPQSRSGCVHEEINSCPCRESNCGRAADGIVADLTKELVAYCRVQAVLDRVHVVLSLSAQITWSARMSGQTIQLKPPIASQTGNLS
jgi:hypothetical protein